MIILVSGATRTVAEIGKHPNLGVLLTPRDRNVAPPRGTIWAADNSAFNGFDPDRFRNFLRRIKGRDDCLWVACPDVVGDAEATMRMWPTWSEVIRSHGHVPALVAQDGLTASAVPWKEVGAVFIGGSTRYKLGESAAQIVGEARRRNLWTHMGRVNSARRLLFAAAIGCLSVDGSGFSRFSETHLPWALRLSGQRRLEGMHD